MKRAGVAVLVVALALLGAVVALRFGGRKLLRFTYATADGGPVSDVSALAVDGWRPWQVPVGGGVTLVGLARPPQTKAAPWVLFFHGNDGRLLTTGKAFLDRLRAGRDWGTALVAYRGFDGSGGAPAKDTLLVDAQRTLDALVREQGADVRQVHLAAFSMGGPVAVALAAQADVASLSLFAGASELAMLPNVPWQKLLRGDELEMGPALATVRAAKVLVAHGGADATLPVSQAKEVAQRLGPKATLLEVPGVGHEALLESEPALAAARALIDPAPGPG